PSNTGILADRGAWRLGADGRIQPDFCGDRCRARAAPRDPDRGELLDRSPQLDNTRLADYLRAVCALPDAHRLLDLNIRWLSCACVIFRSSFLCIKAPAARSRRA